MPCSSLRRYSAIFAVVVGFAALFAAQMSCSVPASLFNSSFVDLVDGEGTGATTSIENASGHVPILFVNNLRYDGQMAEYLTALRDERRLFGVEPTQNIPSLTPLVRMRIRVTYENGNSAIFELVSGDPVVELEFQQDDQQDTGVQQVIDPALERPPLTRLVAACNVARVEVEDDPQVFVPVFVRTINILFGDFGGRTRELVTIDSPQFQPLQPDEVDANFNVTLQRNFNVRDAPAPINEINCGRVVGIVLNGTVRIPFTPPEDEPPPADPFVQERDDIPGVIDTDVQGQASIPGRVTFNVSVQ